MKLDDLLYGYPEDKRKTAVVPMANNEEIIGCIDDAIKMGLVNFILIGEKKKILEIADKHNVDLGKADFIEESDDVTACNKAVELVKEGKAHILMKGLVQTSTFTRAILNKEAGLIDKGRLISHVSVLEISSYHKTLFLTDAGINIDPTLEQKVEILNNALTLVKKLGIVKPKVACLSAVEKVSPKMKSTIDGDAIAKMASEGKFGDAIVEGPLSFDVAISKEAADIKGMKSEVAGDPDIFLAPGIDAANILYKCITNLIKAKAACIVAGVNVPVVLTSRADTEETKLLSLALATKLATTQ